MNAGSFPLIQFRFLWTVLLTFLVQSASAQTNFPTSLIDPGTTWRYWNQETPPGGNWKALEFDDSTWLIGVAQLGYGDGDETTETRTNDAPHPISAYFRKNFFLTSTNHFSRLFLSLVRDDGAIVYINGREVLRDAMPDGEIGHNTAATMTASPPSESEFRDFIIDVPNLRIGTNTVAVEVHQANPASSDLSFDLSLDVRDPNPEYPVVSIVATQPNTSEPLPNALVAPGVFTISRTERSLEQPLRVHVEYGGSASPADYEELPSPVVIPAGTNSVQLLVLPKSDSLVEGMETLVARIVPIAATALAETRAYQVDPARFQAEVRIHDEDQPNPNLPVVSLSTLRAVTKEPRPNEDVAAGIFRLQRSGSTDSELSVLLGYSGSATPNVDYEALPDVVTFEKGSAMKDLSVFAPDDGLVEETETVHAELIQPPTAGMALMYLIHPTENSGAVQILDRDHSLRPTLRITQPEDGEVLPAGHPIQVTAVAVDPQGYIPRVEFYAGDLLIGVSEIAFIHPPPDGTPITHDIVWSNAPAGSHTLVARAEDSNGNPVTSSPVTIFVGDTGETPVVSIRARDPIATEVPMNSDAMDFATFEITRSGPLDSELVVFFSLHGTARVNADYNHLGESVRVGAGHRSSTVTIIPILDGLTVIEPMETVAIRLEPVPHDRNFASYGIAETQDAAAAVIYDGQPPADGRIVFAIPDAGAELGLNEQVTVLAAAYHPTLEIVHLEFLLDGQLIGRSDLDVPAGMRNLFFHRLDWKAMPLGEHVLSARGLIPILHSEPVPVTIGAGSEAHIAITRPRNGEVFPLGTPIEIEAVAVDPHGYIPRLEFYADGQLIGVSEIAFIRAPDPGTPIQHSIIWSNAPFGRHVLTARGVDSQGERVTSNPVTITVTGEIHKRVVLAIEATDRSAMETPANGALDPAVFVVRRIAGPTNVPVSVFYNVSGTAQNGFDYERLSGGTQLNAGEMETEILVGPIPDPLTEGEESVVITLREPNCRMLPFIECYQIGSPSQAQAFIRDGDGTNLPPRVSIHRPRDGSVFEVGQPVVIYVEGSDLDGSVEQIELYANDRLLWRTNVNAFTYTWLPPGQGHHTVIARVLDNAGGRGESLPVRILVNETTIAVAERDLPDSYVPGAPHTVALDVNPPFSTRAWALEDQPPQRWTVSEISHGGVFDPATGKVKFGPFNDGNDRRLSYRVTPPVNAIGEQEFTGTASADGRAFRIAGDQVIPAGAGEHHPADANEDNRIVLVELTGYSAAWKGGSNGATRPAIIPMSYVTRAAMIWRQGEKYHFAANQSAPFCWVPDAEPPLIAATAPVSAIRTMPAQVHPGDPLPVTIEVQPAAGTSAYAIEEKVPHGWTVSAISDDGVFDAETSSIRWGAFMDSHARALRYTLTSPPGVTSVAELRGDVSFDGRTQRVEGSTRIVAAESSAVLHLPLCERRPDGKVQLKLAGAPGQLCILEASSDLATWILVDELFLPDGQLDVVDDTGAARQRYYRLRTR